MPSSIRRTPDRWRRGLRDRSYERVADVVISTYRLLQHRRISIRHRQPHPFVCGCPVIAHLERESAELDREN